MRLLSILAMSLLTTVATVASIDTADAGTLNIEKRGMIPAFVWVDGESMGKVKKRKPVTVDVEPGEHEVWVSMERDGVVTRCHGLVDVPATGATVEVTDMSGCLTLREGFGYGANTAFRGSSVDFSMTNVEAWVQVDGGQPMALPQMPFLLNLDPGTHTIVLWRDNMQESVVDQGTVTLAKGQHLPVTCTPSGCMGFDAAPQVIQVFTISGDPAPATGAPGIDINVNIPGMTMGVNLPADSTSSSTMTPSGSSDKTSSDMTCCVNDAFYDCPSASAVYQCSGAFMTCMVDCGMMDMDCPESCMDSHPLDPSACSRNPSRDNTCSQ